MIMDVLILQITGKLGSRIPIVTLISQGIFGCNAVDDEFKEVSLEAKTKIIFGVKFVCFCYEN